jgi:hypothetical protein
VQHARGIVGAHHLEPLQHRTRKAILETFEQPLAVSHEPDRPTPRQHRLKLRQGRQQRGAAPAVDQTVARDEHERLEIPALRVIVARRARHQRTAGGLRRHHDVAGLALCGDVGKGVLVAQHPFARGGEGVVLHQDHQQQRHRANGDSLPARAADQQGDDLDETGRTQQQPVALDKEQVARVAPACADEGGKEGEDHAE